MNEFFEARPRLCKRGLILLITLFLSCTGHHPAPPLAQKIPKFSSYPSGKYEDDYYWLRDKSNPAVLQYLKSENAYTDAVMKDTLPLQEKLFQELKSKIQETDLSVPVFHHGYYYYSRTEP